MTIKYDPGYSRVLLILLSKNITSGKKELLTFLGNLMERDIIFSETKGANGIVQKNIDN